MKRKTKLSKQITQEKREKVVLKRTVVLGIEHRFEWSVVACIFPTFRLDCLCQGRRAETDLQSV